MGLGDQRHALAVLTPGKISGVQCTGSWMGLRIKGKAVPLQARCGPEGSRRFRLPDFHDIRHVNVVRLSASRTGRLLPPGNIPGTHFH